MYSFNPHALRALLAQRAMTREALARSAGLSLAAIGKLVGGAIINPTADTLFRIADVLGCEPRDLMQSEPPPPA